MTKKNIAIVTGGDSAERIISLKSAAVAQKYLEKKYNTYLIDIKGSNWHEVFTLINIDKNDFSLMKDGKKVVFDAVFAALHGAPLENGRLQGYFEILNIPYTCCDGYTSALTMHKHNTKTQLLPHDIPMAKSVVLHKGQAVDMAAIGSLGLPVFIKPNGGGSSFGVTKVKHESEILMAIDGAFAHDDTVLIEAFMQGREFSNGVVPNGTTPVALPITEIVPHTEFFDFAAKYEGKSTEITPAVLSAAEAEQCQKRSVLLYTLLGCKGFVRFDYILVDGVFMFLEANTIPGMTEESLLPQQAVAAGIGLDDLFSGAVEALF